MIRFLGALAARGRYLLVAGLATGVLLPPLAQAMRPWLPEMVAGLMFLAALRIGPRQALGAVRDLPRVLALALLLQLALPLAVAGGAAALGLGGTAVATALILMAAASPIAGAPSLTVLSGGDPAPALRLLIVATALLPVTVLPVFLLAGGLGSPAAVLAAAGRLLAVILLAAGAAFLLRATWLRAPRPETISALDGLSALAMAIVVIGLMAEAGPTLLSRPTELAGWLAVALAANLGVQIVADRLLARGPLRDQRLPLSVAAGNRNIALFLVALPPETTDPLLLFIACYQVPMYLTPLLRRRRGG
ncbi:hypothetical protein DSD19_18315 [Rhodovulum sp. BSW8]|uniref:BASS family bile acid:Na+ symporter n=1 Tax=Rhodovulum visakhapatnamense TaxID=364297 RepID=A0A4R8FV83_9RHOB|nr:MULTISPECIES: hypothetical protein [Rhodovulum]OLS46272.1 hypothetical protein BV509_19235 [Rhodovulum sulfidophilum]MBL3568000.1 hypothetical protein [Rhodovulum visakhapatnamense]MBL3578268.1 hypothetical protein [Rhodovulum visakhapatnamense]RBO51763.1 hypothetical protein DSD19_18315 [Rhodovulum sp. BSW8]TDX30674.1 hypothetical protein EV657_106159 [Rhodovulum visakhapatnamense]